MRHKEDVHRPYLHLKDNNLLAAHQLQLIISNKGVGGLYLVTSPFNNVFPDLGDHTSLLEVSKHSKFVEAQDKHKILEERLQAIKGTKTFGGIDARELSLVLDLVIPSKFQNLNFEKYSGTSCHVNDDKLLINCFQDSLTGSTTRCYNQLSQSKIRSWKDLARAFLNQYKHGFESPFFTEHEKRSY